MSFMMIGKRRVFHAGTLRFGNGKGISNQFRVSGVTSAFLVTKKKKKKKKKKKNTWVWAAVGFRRNASRGRGEKRSLTGFGG